jgi:hypothetical protein
MNSAYALGYLYLKSFNRILQITTQCVESGTTQGPGFMYPTRFSSRYSATTTRTLPRASTKLPEISIICSGEIPRALVHIRNLQPSVEFSNYVHVTRCSTMLYNNGLYYCIRSSFVFNICIRIVFEAVKLVCEEIH